MTSRPEFAARTAGMRPSKLRELVAAAARPSAGDVPGPALLSLGGGLPPAEAFPARAVAAAAERALAGGAGSALQYSATEGDPDLLDLVGADLAGRLRLPDPTGRLLVTTGSQQALDLIGKVLLDPGDVAVVESPAYVGALRALAGYQPRIVEVPVDDDGMDTEVLAGRLQAGLRPKLCYLVPNFSNPSGRTLTARRRTRLAQLAARYGFLVVEDDPYGQLRFAGVDLPPVAADDAEQVVYLGSFSKLVAPGLRVGYLVAPRWLHRALAVAKQATDLNSAALSQRLLVELLTDPDWFAGHLAWLRDLYRARAEALTGAVADRLAGRLVTSMPDGGMFVWAGVQTPEIDALALARAAMRRAVSVVPGNEFSLADAYPRQLRLSFSMLGPAGLVAAVDRLGDAFDDLTASG
ncbi:PLP-dependent aminotransferase family protein [Solwaraspora sp. WMMA2080]|uniref:aminotransferase-like domain-containing protein n=1 Tax=unclassified Solwaraspora TaxID=2627926 RepID=UPI00248B54BC|nr:MULTISPECIES: PLP-dependent aminotransferase family protein [unclassified Solwaraspora]WBB99947.1 PLP-dependent aminotransferase family protein [Solwaraspora sp. WMMA2059]WBC21506.1 PLP-dependent aminotransferase family protein [Solwaraspora sp. WMMA2080]